MSSMTIRNLDDNVKQQLRMQAARHGRSMEDEVRHILRTAVLARTAASKTSLVKSIRARVEPLGGVNLELPPREAIRRPPDMDA